MFSENIFLKIQPDIDQIITFSMVQQQKKNPDSVFTWNFYLK